MLTIKHGFFIIFITWCSTLLYGQNYSNFDHVTPLLNNKRVFVSKTTQDALGNMWVLSTTGILKFDGYNYRAINDKDIFKDWQQPDRVKNILSDSEKNIWFVTVSGLVSKYNSTQGTFEQVSELLKHPVNKIYSGGDAVWLLTPNNKLYRYQQSKVEEMGYIFNSNATTNTHYQVENMCLINKNDLYVSTKVGQVFRYSIKTKQLTDLVGPYTDYPGHVILTTDERNKLWIGTETLGLFVYDTNKKEFIQDSFFSEDRYNINKEMFLSLFCDSKGNIWGSTDGGGLYKINSNTGKIDLFTEHNANKFSLDSNTILNVSEDNHNNIWITTKSGTLNILPYKNSDINYHPGTANNIPQRILSIYKTNKNELWLGTDGVGLTKVTKNSKNEIVTESQFFNDLGLNEGFYVQSITEDSKANIWFGTYKNGLYYHDAKNNTFKKIKIVNSKNQVGTDVRTVFKDSKNRIWVGSNIAINIYDSNRKLLASFNRNTHQIEGSILLSIAEDRNGTIWLGMNGSGLFEFNENINNLQNSNFSKQPYFKNEERDVMGIKYISVGKANELWLISNTNKLLKYNTKNKTYSSLDNLESIDYGYLASVLVSGDNLWLSSNNGLIRYNLTSATSTVYYNSDGLQDNMFLTRSAFKDKDGLLYFGGVKGVNFFNPYHIKKHISHPKLYINDIEILNQPIESLLPLQIPSGTFNLKSLDLKNNQSSFSFRFSAIDNILNPKYYYAYRLKGFDKDWITNHTERIATYTNIPAGNYTFEVKAGTKKNNWDIPAKQIHISIAQPFWNTPVAYLLYLALILLIVYGIRRWYLLKKKLLLEKVTNKKEHELYDLKMNFFAKMSHEIQTPITLILGPIEDMLKRAEQNGNLLLKQRLNIISNNASRLSKIARELTLVRDKELNNLKLLVTKNSLSRNIENIALSFKELARNKHIDFTVNYPQNSLKVWYDKEKVEHIIYNLLSNAFKFTPKEGFIQLNVVPTNSKKLIKISVTDSGPGISKNELNTIFELFYQSNHNNKNKGSGIGLALTKELIDLHKGKIEVESILNEGTTFTVTLPISEDAYTESERITTSEIEEPTLNIEVEKDEEIVEGENNLNKKTILIVEDNYELQNFLKELLMPLYNIIAAENGEEGYYYAKSNFPDLILSDIMMPKLNGIEMCRKLQEDNLTKHIPLVLLTAKNSTKSKISGLKSGAIEYINKPFNTNELLLKIKNIISSKEHIISKYRKEAISRPEVLINKSQDEIFLENLVAKINLKIADANLKMEDLAASLNISYSRLYRKCQALTGHSVIDFVRLIRLKKAAILMTKYGYNISETSFKTGFNDPKYFSKCFKRQFKKTPVSFKKEAIKSDIDKYLKKHNITDLELETS
ncbi:ATP-binding protein [Hwangdonia lutea]|uniref:histidine kinase n=1 Tax=Hwangdonia lutea TaxID=3075823 RepID=A0AA97EMP0_9FLAO|nr:ATP-binding protein [Hwangdonia sp. SCSIO 19198]WOD44142.1 ATP-binding protein [Hwangdonia sp. SCSIO 19198]